MGPQALSATEHTREERGENSFVSSLGEGEEEKLMCHCCSLVFFIDLQGVRLMSKCPFS